MIRVHVVSNTNSTDSSIISVDTENNWDSLTKQHFLTFNEVVLDLCSLVSKEDREWIKSIKFDNLIQLHHSVGRYIRNTYGLWHPNHPLLIKDDLGDGHPDGISFKIIQAFHKYLNNPHTEAYEDAMSILTQEK